MLGDNKFNASDLPRILERKRDAASVVWKDEETGRLVETPVTGGRCKLQWKADWAMRMEPERAASSSDGVFTMFMPIPPPPAGSGSEW